MKLLIIALLTTILSPLSAAEISITKADISKLKASESKLKIVHSGIAKGNPTITVKNNTLSVSIPNSSLKAPINRTSDGINLTATENGNEIVTINLELPYSLEKREGNVAVSLKDGSIEVNFPRIEVKKAAAVQASRSPSVKTKPEIAPIVKNDAEAEKFDENYLNEIAKSYEKKEEVKAAVAAAPAKEVVAKKDDNKKDGVTLTQSSVSKSAVNPVEENKSNFSIIGYVGKFVAFMAVMIGVFYGVVTLLKKGVIKQGKLGFLNSTKLVEVLSTTHVAPKRTLMMVKAHKQVFLIASSESGIQYLSEIKDVTGLIKTGEEELTGSNFDTNLNSASKESKEFKLKEPVKSSFAEDFAMESLDDMLGDEVPERSGATSAARAIEKSPVEDQVRFSDLVKTKVKNMKQL